MRVAIGSDHAGFALKEAVKTVLAVLERAVADFRNYANVPPGRGRWLFLEVAAWFDSSETGPFDFEAICEVTGLDPDFIRNGLLASTAPSARGLHDGADRTGVMPPASLQLVRQRGVDPAHTRSHRRRRPLT